MADLQFVKLIADLGVVGVCVWVMWLGWKREERSAAAFEKLNDRSASLNQETIKAITELTTVNRELHHDIRNQMQAQWTGPDRRHKGE